MASIRKSLYRALWPAQVAKQKIKDNLDHLQTYEAMLKLLKKDQADEKMIAEVKATISKLKISTNRPINETKQKRNVNFGRNVTSDSKKPSR